MRIAVALVALVSLAAPAAAQNATALVVSACGALPAPFIAGRPAPFTVDTNGQLCQGAAGSTAPLTVNGIATLTGLAVSTCGSVSYPAGRVGPITIDANGNAC